MTMTEITIEGKIIGTGHSCYIIAEAGLNHDGKVEQAKELVDAAKKSGADLVKFQVFETKELCSLSSKAYPLFKSLELTKEQWKEVAAYASHREMPFSASVFGDYSLGLLKEMRCGCVKIASSDITYGPLLIEAAKTGLPLVISTGMSYLGEVDQAVRTFRQAGGRELALLHCVSNYPTSPKDANLKSMRTMRSAFQVPVGFSDHTMDDIVPLAAVAMGANILEKHFTLDRGLPGPDHKLSMIPEEFEKMVRNVRCVESAMGSGDKVPVEKEMPVRLSARRSIVANHMIAAGNTICRDDVRIARPGSGIGPDMMQMILGRKAKRDISSDTPLTWDDL
jgi:sialic acid synthase SpsE